MALNKRKARVLLTMQIVLFVGMVAFGVLALGLLIGSLMSGNVLIAIIALAVLVRDGFVLRDIGQTIGKTRRASRSEVPRSNGLRSAAQSDSDE